MENKTIVDATQNRAFDIATYIQKKVFYNARDCTPFQLKRFLSDRELQEKADAILNPFFLLLKKIPKEKKSVRLEKIKEFYKERFGITLPRDYRINYFMGQPDHESTHDFNAFMYKDRHITLPLLVDALSRLRTFFDQDIESALREGKVAEDARDGRSEYIFLYNDFPAAVDHFGISYNDLRRYMSRKFFMNFTEWALCVLYAQWEQQEVWDAVSGLEKESFTLLASILPDGSPLVAYYNGTYKIRTTDSDSSQLRTSAREISL